MSVSTSAKTGAIQFFPLGIDSPDSVYKLHVLMLLGLGPDALDRNLRNINDVVTFYRSGRDERLTPELRLKAEQWAREMYQAHFIGVPDAVKGPNDAGCM
jgi:hypothetical protein